MEFEGEFSTFDELSVVIRQWEEKNRVTLYNRSSRSIAATRKRAPKRSFNDELQFSELDYACVHGGREYKPKSSNKREIKSLSVSFTTVEIYKGLPIHHQSTHVI